MEMFVYLCQSPINLISWYLQKKWKHDSNQQRCELGRLIYFKCNIIQFFPGDSYHYQLLTFLLFFFLNVNTTYLHVNHGTGVV